MKDRTNEATDSARPGAQGWANLAAIALILAVGAAIYANSFSGVFVFDDRQFILGREGLWRSGSVTDIIARHLATPVQALTLAGNYAAGGLDVRGYHLVNLAIHVLNALTLFGIVRRTLLTERLRDRFGPVSTPLAAAVALVWTAHPIQTEAVTYIIQRKESLMALFYLLTLYCFMRAGHSSRRAWWRAAAVAACLLGMGTKQVMVTAPVMVLLYDRTFLSGTFGKAIRRSWGFYIFLFATWAVLVGSFQRVQQEGVGVPEVKLTPLVYAQTQFGVVLHYLRLCFWPTGLTLDYGWPVARTPGDWLLPGAVVLALAGGAATLLFWRAPALGFAGAWFFLILAPSSSILVIREVIFEHRMYLPLAGVAALVVMGTYRGVDFLLQRLAPSVSGRRLAVAVEAAAVAVIVCVLGQLTVRRNADYHSELGFWSDAVDKRPDNPRAHCILGMVLMSEEKTEAAIAQFNRAIALKADYGDPYAYRGAVFARNRQYERALADFEKALQLNPYLALAYYSRGRLYDKVARYPQALQDYTRAIQLKDNYAEAYNNRGAVFAKLGQRERALHDYERAIAIAPRHAEAYNNRGIARWESGRRDEAMMDFTRAIELQGDFAEAYHNRANALAALGRYDQAIRDFTKVIELEPDGPAYYGRAVAFFFAKAYDQAWADIAACRELGLDPDAGFLKALSDASGRRE